MMKLAFVTVLLLIGSSLAVKKVNVHLFYETICPGCQQEFVRSVVPAQKAIGQYLNFDLVPWGNARIFKNEYVFGIICQHGEAECWGNAFHVCVIDKYDYEKAFDFVACFFRTYENIKDVKGKCESCSKEMNFDFAKMKQCAEGDEGQKLVLGMHNRTVAIAKGKTGVPWTVIENVATGDDITEYACKEFLKAQGVEYCQKY
ncbi:hypothetical protein DERF_005681 [Dermatophagoides farinae]|uniref:Gilt-like protein n=1 Tax=Dermatophagoides farinae TaxID=6954 RepID=A0A922I9Z5_DERFA|nr:gamma-interferon-inducible lysosomal thiol reductase-like [Dermatophagoides farinae]KAH7639331.1 gilt-like protein [Dermatophagoides farinae]KAH9522078.1 hypothetical protein DERF_005681 [Dermatophagoides farinae]